MFKTSNCNRTRLVAALFLCMLFCQVPSAIAYSFGKMFHVQHQSQHLNDCVYVNVFDDGRTAELVATANSLSSSSATHPSGLKWLNHDVLKPAIPLNQPQFVRSQSGLLSGCRWLSVHGLRDGRAVTVGLQTIVTAAFRILTVEDQRAFGVYDE